MCWYRADARCGRDCRPPTGAAIDATPDRGLAWPHGSGLRFKRDDDVSRFGLVRLQAIRIGLAPVGEIYNFGPRSSRPGGAGGLHDAESVAVEEECVLPEYVVQLRNHGMVVGNRLTLQLAQGPGRSLISSHTPFRMSLCVDRTCTRRRKQWGLFSGPWTLSVHLRTPREPSSESGKRIVGCTPRARATPNAFSQHVFLHLSPLPDCRCKRRGRGHGRTSYFLVREEGPPLTHLHRCRTSVSAQVRLNPLSRSHN